MTTAVLVAAAATLAVVGVTVRAAEAGETPAFADCASFTQHMRAVAEAELTQYLDWAYQPGREQNEQLSGASQGDEPSVYGPSLSGGPEVAVGTSPTGTNVQEQAVDEPDIVKADGSRVVLLRHKHDDLELHVVDTAGPPPYRSTRLGFGPGNALGSASELLVLGGHRVAVMRAFQRPWGEPDYHTQGTELTVVDIADPARPTIVLRQYLSGQRVSARLHDGILQLVLRDDPRVTLLAPRDGEAPEAAAARNRAMLADLPAEVWLPAHEVRDSANRVLAGGPAIDCRDTRLPRGRTGIGLLTVLTVDTERGESGFRHPRGAALLGTGERVYASTDRLYVADDEDATTRIHAFDTTSRGRVHYVGSGTVHGFLLGPSALSERRGLLRVATTTRPVDQFDEPDAEAPPSESAVVVLEERAGQLRPVGSVGGLGPGEQIQAVRWFDDMAVIVTYRQIDPLYLISLSDPARPTVRGELKVPGFSAYLHPVGAGHVLGIGPSSRGEWPASGYHAASSFDVTRGGAPVRTDVLPLGGYTYVDEDPHAFTFLPSRGLALLPGRHRMPWTDAKCLAHIRSLNKGSGAWIDLHEGQDEICGPQPFQYTVTGVHIDATGQLSEAARYNSDTEIERVLPIGDRLAAVTENFLILLTPDTLRPIESIDTTR